MENLAKQTDITGMQSAGRVLPLWRGDYSDSTFYEQTDIVLYNNSSYIAKQDTIGNTPPESSLNANDYWQLVAKGIIDTDMSDTTVEFTQAKTRTNIQSGEDGRTLFGKISKWFADLKPVAFSNSYNDLDNQPQSLKNPNALTFTGAVTGSYDGSATKSVAIPSVGNGTLTIQKNGTNVHTFTANQSSDATANIIVPTNAADVGAVPTFKVLTTKEQVNANTDTSNVAGATAVKAMVAEINSNLDNVNLLDVFYYFLGDAVDYINDFDNITHPIIFTHLENAPEDDNPAGSYWVFVLTLKRQQQAVQFCFSIGANVVKFRTRDGENVTNWQQIV